MHLHLHRSGHHRLLLRSKDNSRERDCSNLFVHVEKLPSVVDQCLEHCICRLHERNMDAIFTRELLEKGLCDVKVLVLVFEMDKYTENATHLAIGISSLSSWSYHHNTTKGGRSWNPDKILAPFLPLRANESWDILPPTPENRRRHRSLYPGPLCYVRSFGRDTRRYDGGGFGQLRCRPRSLVSSVHLGPARTFQRGLSHAVAFRLTASESPSMYTAMYFPNV